MTGTLFLMGALMFGPPLEGQSPEIPLQSPPEVQQLLNQLPACSTLHESLEHGKFGDGVDQPYMQEMRKEGVQRVLFMITSTRVGQKVKDLQVVRRLYFDKYDGPNAQITGSTELSRIRDSGLQKMLDNLALDRVKKAHFFVGREGAGRSYKEWYSYAEFFSNPWLPEQETVISPLGRRLFPLTIPANAGDSVELKSLLRDKHFQQAQLDRGLFEAVVSRYDNTAAINLLLNAGADLNAKGDEGMTPLMSAVDRPCNLGALLKSGASLTARDKSGTTALKRARNHKQLESVRLLEQAGAR